MVSVAAGCGQRLPANRHQRTVPSTASRSAAGELCSAACAASLTADILAEAGRNDPESSSRPPGQRHTAGSTDSAGGRAHLLAGAVRREILHVLPEALVDAALPCSSPATTPMLRLHRTCNRAIIPVSRRKWRSAPPAPAAICCPCQLRPADGVRTHLAQPCGSASRHLPGTPPPGLCHCGSPPPPSSGSTPPPAPQHHNRTNRVTAAQTHKQP